MKLMYSLLFFVAFGVTATYAQSMANPPTIAVKVPLGETVVVGDVSVTFVAVLQDSRCPLDVTCVWAGEVKILVRVEHSRTIKTEKEMVLSNSAIQSAKNQLLLMPNYRLDVLNVTPVPSSIDDKSKVAYTLLVVQTDVVD